MQVLNVNEINKLALVKKIQTIQTHKVSDDLLYACTDVINALSNSIIRDLRYINDFSTDEIKVIQVLRVKTSKLVKLRFFTKVGLTRYLHEGKVYSYKLACEYFSVQTIDLTSLAHAKTIAKFRNSDNLYNVNQTLKWIFEKRKSCKSLNTFATNIDIINFVKKILKNESKNDSELSKFTNDEIAAIKNKLKLLVEK